MTTSAEAMPRLVSGRYELGPVIGRGGMGEVRRARDQRLGRDVAIKFLRADLAAHPVVRARFEQEARAAAGLSHPNAVIVFDTAEDDGDPYIVMECLPGPTLADEMARGPLAIGRVRQLASEVLGALSAAHALGIVHRDIKPSNLLVCEDGSVKVADFGIAKSTDAIDHTGTGEILGTAAYLPPERLEGRAATHRSDLYALAVVLYEALAGSKPFEADTPVGLVHKIRSAQPVSLRLVRPDADPALVAVVERAMAKDPDDRYDSASEMAAALDRLPAGRTGDGDRTTVIGPVTDVLDLATLPHAEPVGVRRSLAKSRRLVVTLAVLAFVIAIALVVNLSPGGSTIPPTTTAPSTAPTASAPTIPPPLNAAIDELDQAVQP